MIQAPWVAIFPGLMILVTVMAINFVGDGLRDALDPRMRGNRVVGHVGRSQHEPVHPHSSRPPCGRPGRTPIQDGAILRRWQHRSVCVGPGRPVTRTAGRVGPRTPPFRTAPSCPAGIDVHAHLTFGTAWRSYEEVMTEDSDDLMPGSGRFANCGLDLRACVTSIPRLLPILHEQK